MAIEVRTLTGDFLFLGGAPAAAYIVVTPLATSPADATQGILTLRPKRWNITSGAIEDNADIYGGATYSFLVRDIREKDILYFEAPVANVAGDVTIEALYLTATAINAMSPHAANNYGDGYDAGETARIRGWFTDPEGSGAEEGQATWPYVDPTTVTIEVTPPDGVVWSKVYGADAEVTRRTYADGSRTAIEYMGKYLTSQSGRHKYRIIGVLTSGTSIEVGYFTVR